MSRGKSRKSIIYDIAKRYLKSEIESLISEGAQIGLNVEVKNGVVTLGEGGIDPDATLEPVESNGDETTEVPSSGEAIQY